MTNKKNILMIAPSTRSESSMMSRFESIIPPLGLLYIAAVIEKDHNVQIYDYNIEKRSLERTLKDFVPDYALISINYSFQFPGAIMIIERIKNLKPNIKMVAGGVHISSGNPKFILDNYKNIDFIIRGDGEYAVKKLLSGERLSKIEGLCYRKSKKTYVNRKAQLNDLDSIPIPARHLIDFKRYHHTPFEYTDHRNTFMITSRGCNYGCITCSTTRYRTRSIENVIKEIKELLSKGIRDITFFDACFSFDMKRAENICDRIIQEGLRFTWACETRVDRVNDALLSKMFRAGCRSIMYGIESGNTSSLEMMDKRIGLDKIRESIDMTKKHGIKAYGSVMLGFPKETDSDLQKTIDFSKSLDLDLAWFTIATPLPGTYSWKLADYDENDLNTLDKISFYSGDIAFLEKERIERWFSRAVTSFYLRPRMIFRLLMDMLTYGTIRRRLNYIMMLPSIIPIVALRAFRR